MVLLPDQPILSQPLEDEAEGKRKKMFTTKVAVQFMNAFIRTPELSCYHRHHFGGGRPLAAASDSLAI